MINYANNNINNINKFTDHNLTNNYESEKRLKHENY